MNQNYNPITAFLLKNDIDRDLILEKLNRVEGKRALLRTKRWYITHWISIQQT